MSGQGIDDASQKRRDRFWAWGCCAAVHLAVLAGLLWPRHAPPLVKPEPSTLMVSIAEAPKPPGPPMDSEPGGRNNEIQPVMPQPVVPVFSTVAAPDNSDLLSDSQVAGAAGVGEGGGGGGGGCDLARAVQQALRQRWRDSRFDQEVKT